MAPKLYMIRGSPPCRAVFATAKALGITLDMYEVNLEKGEHLGPTFLKINPQHTVPVLVDDGKIICDSHAISTYLIDKYGKNDSLYPKDLYKRAVVNEKLYFECGLFANMKFIFELFKKREAKSVPHARAKAIEESYSALEKFLQGRQWVADDNVTLADFSLFTTVSTSEVLVGINQKSFPNLTAWLKRVKALPWFEGDDEEQKAFVTWLSSVLSY